MDFLNKKGILFTMISLMVAGFFILLFSAPTTLPLDSNTDSVDFRVNVLNRYRQGWEDFSRDSLKAASYNAFGKMAGYVHYNSLFTSRSDFESDFEECLKNGTINGGSANCSGNSGKNNKTIYYWLDTLAGVAESNMSFETNYTLGGVGIRQRFPFLVEVEMNMSYEVSDVFASVKRNVTLRTEVPIRGLREPLSARMFPASSVYEIEETPVKSNDWNLTVFGEFVQNQSFRYHESAPSFLMRFYGDTDNSSCCGIETVYTSELQGFETGDDDIQMENVTFVDHMYYDTWDDGSPSWGCSPDVYGVEEDEVPNKTQVDDIHLASFNVNSTHWTNNCE